MPSIVFHLRILPRALKGCGIVYYGCDEDHSSAIELHALDWKAVMARDVIQLE